MYSITKIALITILKLFFLISADSTIHSSATSLFGIQEETTLDVFKNFHKKYGEARMVLKDRSIYKKIKVHEINAYWIVFVKNGSLHDMLIEKIARIQFGQGLGPIVTFNKDNSIRISY